MVFSFNAVRFAGFHIGVSLLFAAINMGIGALGIVDAPWSTMIFVPLMLAAMVEASKSAKGISVWPDAGVWKAAIQMAAIAVVLFVVMVLGIVLWFYRIQDLFTVFPAWGWAFVLGGGFLVNIVVARFGIYMGVNAAIKEARKQA